MTELSISEKLTYSTVRIECRLANGDLSTGTGFFFLFLNNEAKNVPAIVTNKHVVEGAVEGAFKMHEGAEDGSPTSQSTLDVSLDKFSNRWIPHPDPDIDLCILPAGPIFHDANTRGKKPFLMPLDPKLVPTPNELSDLTAVEDILMIGYPNGIWDSENNMPIVRRGITATHPAKSYEGRPEFVIDAACFPGSSGSPVVLFNQGSYPMKGGGVGMGTRIKLLGVLYAGPQYNAKGEILSRRFQRAIARSQYLEFQSTSAS
jgi:hypothetical protein